MATPHVTASPGNLDSTNFAQAVCQSGGSSPKQIVGRQAYTGSAWAVNTSQYRTTDFAVGTWSTDHLVIVTTGYTSLPTASASPATLTAYDPIAITVDNSGTYEVHIYFRNSSYTQITTEDTNMDFILSVNGT